MTHTADIYCIYIYLEKGTSFLFSMMCLQKEHGRFTIFQLT